MNYIGEINSFERWLETHYLPAQSQLLWYKLIALFNRCGWAEWVTVDNQRLMGLIQCQSTNTFLRARDTLIEAGLLEYQKGRKGTPNKYRLIAFSSKNEPQMEVYPELKMELYMEPFPELQTAHINKLNKTKLNNKESKKEANPKRPVNNFQVIIDQFTDNQKLKDTIWSFIQMRINKRARPTDKALELVLKHLVDLSIDPGEQILILNQSIVNNWADVYGLKNKSSGKISDNQAQLINDPGRYDFNTLEQRLNQKAWGE